MRTFDVRSVVPGEPQADYSTTLHTVEFPFYQAIDADDRHTVVGDVVKPGQVLLIMPKVEALVRDHIVHVEVHEDLYLYGVPSFKRMYRNGETISVPVHWAVTEPYRLNRLPFVYEIYIINQHIRGKRDLA